MFYGGDSRFWYPFVRIYGGNIEWQRLRVFQNIHSDKIVETILKFMFGGDPEMLFLFGCTSDREWQSPRSQNISGSRGSWSRTK